LSEPTRLLGALRLLFIFPQSDPVLPFSHFAFVPYPGNPAPLAVLSWGNNCLLATPTLFFQNSRLFSSSPPPLFFSPSHLALPSCITNKEPQNCVVNRIFRCLFSSAISPLNFKLFPLEKIRVPSPPPPSRHSPFRFSLAGTLWQGSFFLHSNPF